MASLEVDLTKIESGQTITVKWRGKPVFIKRRTEEDIELANSVNVKELRDPQTDSERTQNPEVRGHSFQVPPSYDGHLWHFLMAICGLLACYLIMTDSTFFGDCSGSCLWESARTWVSGFLIPNILFHDTLWQLLISHWPEYRPFVHYHAQW